MKMAGVERTSRSEPASLSPACGTAEGSLRSSGVPTGVPLAGKELGERGTVMVSFIIDELTFAMTVRHDLSNGSFPRLDS